MLFMIFPAFAQQADAIEQPRQVSDRLQEILAASGPLLGPALQQLGTEAADGDAASMLLLGRYLVEEEPTADRIGEGLALLELAGKAGLVEANFRLGEIYRNGMTGVRRQPARALAFYEAAASAGDKPSGRALAGLLLDQRYRFADRERGLQLLSDLAAAGDVQSLLALGSAYAAAPDGGRQAIDAFNRAAVGGSQSALEALGDLFRKGTEDVPADIGLALQYFEFLGRQGDVSARKKLADIYLKGEAGAPNIPLGLAILRAAAEAGDVGSYIALGDLHSRGELLPIDAARAIDAYEAAAAAGAIDGYLRLGDLYRAGTVGLRSDPAEAQSTYERAVAAHVSGYSSALSRLGDLYRSGADGVAPDGAAAVKYYEQAVGLNDDGARRSLAALLLEGTLVAPDPQRAIEHLTAAAERGDGSAAMQLGGLFSRGGAVPANYDMAVRYFNLAADLGDSTAPLRLAVALSDGPLAEAHRQEGISFLAAGVS